MIIDDFGEPGHCGKDTSTNVQRVKGLCILTKHNLSRLIGIFLDYYFEASRCCQGCCTNVKKKNVFVVVNYRNL